MRIAVVGSGISGLVAAHLLSRAHEVTLFEKDKRLGGHTHTHRVRRADGEWTVDTGFIVCNDRTYPNFLKLLAHLGVATQESDMSFSVRCERTGLEYNGTSLNTIFAQRRNLLRPSFHRMLRDILRFHDDARSLLDAGPELTFDEWLARGTSKGKPWSREFREHYLYPMSAAIWSSSLSEVGGFPARNFAKFFENHGMLSVDQRPTWRTVKGGSDTYIAKIVAPFKDRIRLGTGVSSVRRHDDHVEIVPEGCAPERFDHVVIGSHSDQALRMLGDPSDAEREVLGAIPYKANEAALHVDQSVMPRSRLAEASWNFHLLRTPASGPTVTYDMNRLQRIGSRERFLVTLNRTSDLAHDKVLAVANYEHPLYTKAATGAQARWADVNGVRRTWFCGAYWGWGFHEDGVRSALAVTRAFGIDL
ncbi:MAG: FAD-dependent oxidoreductase [Planctomycetes bacterium]|nr:FAD-dependent oxidoreductase [Planctomycetota bacterium]